MEIATIEEAIMEGIIDNIKITMEAHNHQLLKRQIQQLLRQQQGTMPLNMRNTMAAKIPMRHTEDIRIMSPCITSTTSSKVAHQTLRHRRLVVQVLHLARRRLLVQYR